MNFNKHYRQEGTHALFSASNWYWINYDDEKAASYVINALAAQRGTRLHKYAAESISLGQKLPRSKKTLNSYVNDAIGFGMTPEQVLYFSDNCYGTTDAISFDGSVLRIHDLKTGSIPAHIQQLYVYDALFCHEYGIDPNDISFENRIYQSDDVMAANPEPEEIRAIMDKIVRVDEIANETKMGAY